MVCHSDDAVGTHQCDGASASGLATWRCTCAFTGSHTVTVSAAAELTAGGGKSSLLPFAAFDLRVRFDGPTATATLRGKPARGQPSMTAFFRPKPPRSSTDNNGSSAAATAAAAAASTALHAKPTRLNLPGGVRADARAQPSSSAHLQMQPLTASTAWVSTTTVWSCLASDNSLPSRFTFW